VHCRDPWKIRGVRLNTLANRWIYKSVAAQPSKYQCDGNGEHDAGSDHQNLEDVMARNVII
jgi:hypothetical protein